MVAVRYEHRETIDLTVDTGANVTAGDQEIRPALMVAAHFGEN